MTTRRLAFFIFEEFLSEEIKRKYERGVSGRKITIKDRFISHFEAKSKTPKYDEEISKIILLGIAEKKISARKDLIDRSIKKDGSLHFDFSAFDPLFRDMNSIERIGLDS